jgi:hypothetical protein
MASRVSCYSIMMVAGGKPWVWLSLFARWKVIDQRGELVVIQQVRRHHVENPALPTIKRAKAAEFESTQNPSSTIPSTRLSIPPVHHPHRSLDIPINIL